ncbi:MAG: DNA internalization-related competence protein ComEC/Rec2 [Lachnospiraceae bacterium]|nr:DNA internalization-related competence protein ComEC/Rec2 [Lachnospiraceae bacterium]
MYLIFTYLFLSLHPKPPYADNSDDEQMILISGKVENAAFKSDRLILTISDARKIVKSGAESYKYYKKNNEGHNILVYSDETKRPKIGARIVIRGKKKLFEEATNPGQMDMARYYRNRGTDYMLNNAVIENESREYDVIRELLQCLKEKVLSVFNRSLNADDAGILQAMTLGDKNGLSDDIKGLYQRSGISHSLVVSGLHISLIGMGLYRLLIYLGINEALSGGAGITVMLLYTVMTGSSLSALRAFVMFSLGILSRLIGRTYDILSAIAFSSIILLIANPYYIYDPAFLLSFGAVTGVAVTEPALALSLNSDNNLISAFRVSLAINLTTLPVMAYFFFQIPVYSLVLNLAVIPLVGVLLVLALIAGFLGCVIYPVAVLLSVPIHIILFLIERGCLVCQSLPFGSIVVGRPAWIRIILYYLILSLFLVLVQKIRDGWKNVAVTAGVVVLLPAVICFRIPLKAEITMIDVGQGLCVYIKNTNGHSCLFDCGSTDKKEIARYTVIPFLRSQGTSSLDYVFISHTDSDHYSGIKEMYEMDESESIRIKNLIMPDIGSKDAEYLELIEIAGKSGSKITYISQGQHIKDGDLTFKCLNPGKNEIFEDKNTGSTVLEFEYKGYRGLLTGDVQYEGELRAAGGLSGRYDYLQVAHHGSKNSSDPAFLKKAQPVVAMISCGRNNSYSHPHREALDRLKTCSQRIYITSRVGAIRVFTDGRKTILKKYINDLVNV